MINVVWRSWIADVKQTNFAALESKEIHLASPGHSVMTMRPQQYGIALLHEIGHLRDPDLTLGSIPGSNGAYEHLSREAYAWRWAVNQRRRMGIPLTRSERKVIRQSYRTYLRRYDKQGRKRRDDIF